MKTLAAWWSKKWLRRTLILFTLILCLFMFRTPILRSIGNYLVAEDPLVRTEAYFILGGNSYDRGVKAYSVYGRFPDARFVATGGNFPLQIQALDTVMSEAALTRHWLIRQGVPAVQIDTLSGSTSTLEESDEILRYCREHRFTDITLISSAFHLRRMRMVFEDKYRDAGIRTHFLGAEDKEFNQSEWWRDEVSLITVNNELVKIVYYAVRY
jgi:uncharacterized SAM-binding protein YcdF (DUF218 family)